MLSEYFHKINNETDTRFWINNPSDEEMDKSIAAGAVNVTTNPAYCANLLQKEPEYIKGVIDSVIQEVDDDNRAADIVYQKCVLRVMNKFLPMYRKTNHVDGHVTVQFDPRKETDPDAILKIALEQSKLAENYMAKIPVIETALITIEQLIERNIPICATEVFSISQAVYICELYERVSKKCGKYPPFYVTHITGIFDEYLKSVVEQNNIEIDSNILNKAGCIVARKEYSLLLEKKYKVTMLGGGARGTQHFTELVGGNLHVTINWSTAKELIDSNPPIVNRIDNKASEEEIEELRTKLTDFRKAFDDNGLSIADFHSYGPVELFRNMFLKGYARLLEEISNRRTLLQINH